MLAFVKAAPERKGGADLVSGVGGEAGGPEAAAECVDATLQRHLAGAEADLAAVDHVLADALLQFEAANEPCPQGLHEIGAVPVHVQVKAAPDRGEAVVGDSLVAAVGLGGDDAGGGAVELRDGQRALGAGLQLHPAQNLVFRAQVAQTPRHRRQTDKEADEEH